MKRDFHSEVIYQIYPKSFYDTSRNGFGDLQGIILKLDYLQSLGVTTIWISPVFQSPMKDNGYDISDYYKVDPIFGTNEDLYLLINEAKKRRLNVMLDLVVNHTSDQHQWFQESKSSTSNPYRDFYIWRKKPNNMKSIFLGSAWEKDETTDEYYFHLFTKEQPDLNWTNPKVREQIYNMMNFWIDKGVAGFRMDVIEFLGKEVDKGITADGPKLHEYIHEMNRKTFGTRGCFTVGESWSATEKNEQFYTFPNRQELSMIFRFDHMTCFWSKEYGKWVQEDFDLVRFKEILFQKQMRNPKESWNTLFWGNHDLPRSVSTYIDTEYRVYGAKMLFGITAFMSGTPFIFQGEEIGMTNISLSEKEFKDVEAINALQMLQKEGFTKEEALHQVARVSRDNSRTPMQWDDTLNAGFTTVNPWIKVNQNYKTINVKEQISNKNSILSFYKSVLNLRKKYLKIILYGSFIPQLKQDNCIFAYQRRDSETKLTVIANFSSKQVKLDPKLAKGQILINNYNNIVKDTLYAYQILVLEH